MPHPPGNIIKPLAWITGGGTGIGRALAWELARSGYGVVVSGRTLAPLSALSREAAEAHLAGQVFPLPLDVTDRVAVAAAVATIEQQHGPIALAVLAAGTHIPMSGESVSAASCRSLMEVNYMGVVHVLEALLPHLRQRRAGSVAVIASATAYIGLPTAAAYGPTKAALNTLVQSLHQGLKEQGVHLAVVNPGFVRTPLTAANTFPMPLLMEPEAAAQRILEGLRRGRAEISFPRRLILLLKLLRCLPLALSLPLIRKLTGVP